MRRNARAAGSVALAVAGFSAYLALPSFAGFVVFATAVLAATFTSSPSWLLALCFVSIQVAGEALRLPGMPVSITQVLCLLAVATALRLKVTQLLAGGRIRSLGSIDLAMATFAVTIAIAALVGWAGNAEAETLRQDIVPFVFLAAIYVSARSLVVRSSDLRVVVGGLLVGVFLAAAKVALLITRPIAVSWDGPWQAVRVGEAGSLRIILRGADAFFIICVVFIFSRWLASRTISLLTAVTAILAAAGALLSGTRSNWIGLFAGGVAIIVIALALGLIRWRRVLVGFAAGVVMVLLVLTFSGSVREMVGRSWASATGRTITMDVRAGENRAILRYIFDRAALGSGMGSTFDYYNAELRVRVTAPFSHNAYLEILMKAGVPGLMAFFLLNLLVLKSCWRIVRQQHPWREDVLGLAGAIISLLVLSVGVNKVFSIAGPMFLGLAFGIVQNASLTAPGLERKTHPAEARSERDFEVSREPEAVA